MTPSTALRGPCRSGLVSRKGRKAAPAVFASALKSRGRFAALSRHKAAPTKNRGRFLIAALSNDKHFAHRYAAPIHRMIG
ncbi:hypothetical protein CXG45_10790 [Pseudomonas plecoglossicida]|uniref:Uncharacterized protein n=3 Tax=Pseudomonas TaxID=286 RepID=A0ABX4U5I3_PSEDL|nr:hypothetical protein CX682_11600 [Pseudomonas sp. FFUP_PS_41]PLU93530.1 hypothetical protein CXG45_10790 [Pseudomonas plecoglossicida]PLV16224.1 hypothetical protein CXG47_04990 [Pseudomonas plecoglossicida]TXI03241.1 MAG: hypothetical protein E6Q70_16305 [Pseudomonas monteilii]